MSNKLAVDLAHSYLLLNHGPVTLITSAYNNQVDVMAASWAMPLDFNPAKVIVIMDKNTFTRELVDASGEFGLQIPMRKIAAETVAVGSHSGRDLDKLSKYNIETFAAQKIAAPMIEHCAAWLECKVIPDASDRFDIIIADVLAAYSNPDVYSENRWHFGDNPMNRTIHYVAGGHFFTTGESFKVDDKVA